MLTLYQFPGPWDVCSASPFCAKLEGFLRWQNIPYKSVTVYSTKNSPKGKIPYIEDENGTMGDSTFIIEYLTRKHNLVPDAHLTVEQKAMAVAIRALCEDSLYFAGAWLRWLDDDGWNIVKRDLFGKAPKWLRPVIEWKVQKIVRQQQHAQGTGRHSREEIIGIVNNDIKALADYLGDKKYMFGDEMCTTDLVVFSMISNLTIAPFDNPSARYAKSLENLMAHTQRIRERCFIPKKSDK